MDTNDYYALIAPLIVLLMVFEAWIARRRGLRAHHLPDTIANLATGMGQVLFGVFTGAFLLLLYDQFQSHVGLFTWSKESPAPWIVALFGVDFCYYWFHRTSHAVALLWAVHVVHHQSNEMNLSVAVRQTYFSDFTAILFYWPLPLLGIPREPFFLAVGILSAYQVLQHCALIERPGLWGLLFNTPAYHRLHHACDVPYRDKNFASTLIVWDRLFGTFVTQSIPPTYGTITPHSSHNPVWAQIEPLAALLKRIRSAPTFRDVLSVLFRAPGWVGPWESPHDDVIAPRPIKIPAPLPIAGYVIVQGVLSIVYAELVLFLVWRGTSPLEAAPAVLALIGGTVVFGGLLEQKPWATRAENIRLLVSAAIFSLLFKPAHGSIAIGALFSWAFVSALIFFMLVPRRTIAAGARA